MSQIHQIIESLREDGFEVKPSYMHVGIHTKKCGLCDKCIEHELALHITDTRLGGQFKFVLCLDRPACRQRLASWSTSKTTPGNIAEIEAAVRL